MSSNDEEIDEFVVEFIDLTDDEYIADMTDLEGEYESDLAAIKQMEAFLW